MRERAHQQWLVPVHCTYELIIFLSRPNIRASVVFAVPSIVDGFGEHGVRVCAGSWLKCEYVRSATESSVLLVSCNLLSFEITDVKLNAS